MFSHRATTAKLVDQPKVLIIINTANKQADVFLIYTYVRRGLTLYCGVTLNYSLNLLLYERWIVN